METTGLIDGRKLSESINEDPGFKLQQEVKILYELLPMGHWINLAAAIILFSLLLQYIDQDILIRWFGGFLFVICLRVIISINFRESSKTAGANMFWYNMFLVGTALYGVMWSGTAIYLVPSESSVITSFTALLLCGLAAGSVAISSVNLKVFMVFAISSIWPYAALLIFSSLRPQMFIGWLMMFFYVVITLMAIQVHRYFSNLIKLELKARFLEEQVRFENNKRKMVEKAMLDNTLEEELAEQIRHQAKSLKNELSNVLQPEKSKADANGGSGTDSRQLVAYKPYLEKLNNTIISQLISAHDILKLFKESHMSEEHHKRISLVDKILNDVVTAIEKLDIYEGEGIEDVESIQIRKINLRQLAIFIAHEVPLLYKSKYLTIKRHIDSDVPKYVYGDSKIIRDSLKKLVLNSFQYSDGGTISINIKNMSEDDDEIVILFEVEDTGVGIPQNMIKDFLDDSVMDEDDPSGLNVVKRSVTALGGKLFANSVLGVGSTIGFSVPFIKEGDLLEI